MKRRLKQIFVGALSAVMLLPGVRLMDTYAADTYFTRIGNVLYDSSNTKATVYKGYKQD